MESCFSRVDMPVLDCDDFTSLLLVPKMYNFPENYDIRECIFSCDTMDMKKRTLETMNYALIRHLRN